MLRFSYNLQLFQIYLQLYDLNLSLKINDLTFDLIITIFYNTPYHAILFPFLNSSSNCLFYLEMKKKNQTVRIIIANYCYWKCESYCWDFYIILASWSIMQTAVVSRINFFLSNFSNNKCSWQRLVYRDRVKIK